MSLFNEQEQERIRQAVASAERSTSGEIRICVEKSSKDAALDRAVYFFHKLDMHKTKRRNGVLIYLAVLDKQVAIIGDSGINSVVPPTFWDSTKEAMVAEFKKGAFLEGILTGIERAGQQLKTYFPSVENDTNELSNDIAFGDDE
ncbi:MAG: TPM domain-containing protein [Sphingobacteriaceae bacterium]